MLAGSPAFFASAAIADGVMSGEPTICSSLRLLWTVERPFTPMTIAAMPKPIRTAAATRPPISNSLRISAPSFVAEACARRSTFVCHAKVSAVSPRPPSGRARNISAGIPRPICGNPVTATNHLKPLEQAAVLLEMAVAEELGCGPRACVRAQPLCLVAVAQERLDGPAEGGRVGRVVDEQAVLPAHHLVDDAADGGRDDRTRLPHRL